MPETPNSKPCIAPDLTVMSYNVRYANPNDERHVWEWRRDGVASAIRFHRPDLIGLQEASHEQVAELRERLPPFQWLTAGRPSEGDAGEYAAIGYDPDRFDVTSDETFWLSETPSVPGSRGWDAKLPRIVRHARLFDRVTDTDLCHFNTHFDHRGEVARLESAKLLVERIDDVPPGNSVAVTGDFNSRPTTDVYRLLTARREDGGRTLVDAHASATQPHHGPETTMTDFHNLVPGKQIDYVLVSEDVQVNIHGIVSSTTAGGLYPSDHLPVLARVSLPEGA